MSFENIVTVIGEKHEGAILETITDKGDPTVVLGAEHLVAVMTTLQQDERTKLDHLSLVSGVDYVKEGIMEVVYHLDSLTQNTPFVLKVRTDRENCHVPSIVSVYKTADWHEREVYDLSGVIFDGHPNLTRILCADDWVGHPLRKDYDWPETYHGLPCGPFAKEEKNIPAEWEIEGFSTRNSG